MGTQEQVGKLAAVLMLVLVKEAQCQININILLDTPNSGRCSITGHIAGDTFVAGPAAYWWEGYPLPPKVIEAKGPTETVVDKIANKIKS